MTRKEQKEKLLIEVAKLIRAEFGDDEDLTYFVAIFDDNDNCDMFTSTSCPRCAVDSITESLDANNIGHNSDSRKDSVH